MQRGDQHRAFAGHGEFRTEAAEKPGALEGEGLLIFDDGFGDAEAISAYDLARALRAVGVRVAVVGACLSGRLDDLRIWSVVRSAAEIAGSYQTELPAPPSGLVGNWKFNEGLRVTARHCTPVVDVDSEGRSSR